MPRGLQFSIFVILGVALSAFTPGNDHNLMNASSGPIVLDIRSSRDQPITHFRLSPGHSVGFNGVFQHLRVRMVSGKMLTFSERQLIELHGDSVPTRGGFGRAFCFVARLQPRIPPLPQIMALIIV
jgi:hypothetical protein